MLPLLSAPPLAVQDLQLDISFGGMVIAAVSVVSSGLQQIFVRTMQQKHKLTAHELLSNTAPAQVRPGGVEYSAVLAPYAAVPAVQGAAAPAACSCPRCCWAARLKPDAASSGTAAAGQLLSKVPSAHSPAQAWTLLLVGPFIDKLASNDWVFNYTFTQGAAAGGQVGQRGGAACIGSRRLVAPALASRQLLPPCSPCSACRADSCPTLPPAVPQARR